MSDIENEAAWKCWRSYSKAHQARLIAACYQAALYLTNRVNYDGWRWADNYMREHARCTTKPKLKFSNTCSPVLYRLMREAHPDITFKNDDQASLFDALGAARQTPNQL